MPDQIEELFAGLRTQTVSQLRPPGAAAARQTVRRRRARASAAAVAALVLVVGATVGLGHRGAPDSRLTGTAVATLDSGSAAIVADQGPVRTGYRRTVAPYLGELTLAATCAGSGSITFVVSGVPSYESGRSGNVELTRRTVACRSEPQEARTSFVVGQYIDVVIAIDQVDSARKHAAFAYRITSDTLQPVAVGAPAADPLSVLHLPDPPPAGSGDTSGLIVKPGATEEGGEDLSGSFRFVGACAGQGRMTVRIKKDGVVLKSMELRCSYPAERREVAVGEVGHGDISVAGTYHSTTQASAQLGYQFLRT
jgi:hypothetical protein